MLMLQGIAYLHPNREPLFSDIDIVINNHSKVALTGNNGTGKSTLLKIMGGILQPASGKVKTSSQTYYVPQHFGQYNELTIAQALCIDNKLAALKEMLNGNITDHNIALLNDDWTLEERCTTAFAQWQLHGLELTQSMNTLSGGQKTKVFLAGIAIHRPDIVLLDEPSNHLDAQGRSMLYNYIQSTNKTLVVISHDRTMLNLLDTVLELSPWGINSYGGNYDFYAAQKAIERDALDQDVKNKEKALRKAKETEREAIERQQKLDARGKKKQEKAGLPTISMNTLRNNAEKSTARTKGIHEEKVDAIAHELSRLRQELPGINTMKMAWHNATVHKGKVLITAQNVNFAYGSRRLWQEPLSFQVVSGERIAIKGPNGSGKTTLIRMLLGQLQPATGNISRAAIKAIYIDQDYSLISNTLTVYQQAQQFNSEVLQEHEVKIRLNRFLFTKAHWNRPCTALSGGEKMRLMLCCLTISNQAPDMMVLDEPTNNLDIQNMGILTAAINEYKGTLLVVSHDEYFLNQVNAQRSITTSG